MDLSSKYLPTRFFTPEFDLLCACSLNAILDISNLRNTPLGLPVTLHLLVNLVGDESLATFLMLHSPFCF